MSKFDEITPITIAEFIAKHGVTMTAEPTTHNPHMMALDTPDEKRWQKEAAHYLCQINGPRGTVETTFSVGVGILDHWARENKKAKTATERELLSRALHPYARYNKTDSDILDAMRARWRKAYRPDLESVLDCLASDSHSVRNARHFEEWAADCGYDTDSRRAETTYRICEKIAAQLEDALGREAFDELLEGVEPL